MMSFQFQLLLLSADVRSEQHTLRAVGVAHECVTCAMCRDWRAYQHGISQINKAFGLYQGVGEHEVLILL